MDCLFCKIVNGEIPSNKVYEDDKILAFFDICPEAKIHVLVVPKSHISSADDINENNCCEVGYIFSKIPMIAKKAGITNGYRIITNSGPDSCQSVMHLHFHILGGEKLPEHIR